MQNKWLKKMHRLFLYVISLHNSKKFIGSGFRPMLELISWPEVQVFRKPGNGNYTRLCKTGEEEEVIFAKTYTFGGIIST